MEMLEAVVAVSVYLVRVVVSAVDPVASHIKVPAELFKRSLARGNMVPPLALFFIQRVNVTAAPDGIEPEAFGTPL